MSSTFLINGALSATSFPPLDDATLEGLLTFFGAQRARALETSVRNEASENRASNARVNSLNSVLQVLGSVEPSSDTKDTPLGGDIPAEAILVLVSIRFGATSFEHPVGRFLSTNSNGQRTVAENGDFARLRETVRTEVDKASSDSQLNLIRMQGIINRSNQATEFITNIVQRFSGVEDRINPNFRQ